MLTAVIYAIVIFSTIWVILDSRRNQVPFGKEVYSPGHSSLLWLIICIVIWIAAFPIYLLKRAKTLKARNPAAPSSALPWLVGGLVFAVALLCMLASVLMAFGIMTVNGGRISDTALSKQVADAIERNWRGNPDSSGLHMKEVSLHHTDGNDYDGVATVDVSGETKQYGVHVTYDGKQFSYKVTDEITATPAAAEAPQPPQTAQTPEDKLKSLVAKNIKDSWKLDPASKKLRLKDLALQHESGDHYTGTATADDAGQEKRFPLQVTYDSVHNNLSVQMGEEEKRMTDEALRVEIRDAIEKKWRETTTSQDVHMKDITLSRDSGDNYVGVVTARVSNHEEQYALHATYDGSHWSYEVGDELPLSVEQLRSEVGDMIEKKWRENPKSSNVHFVSMTLEGQGGGEYLGVVTANVSGRAEKHAVKVHYDGKHFNYEVE